MTSSLLDDRHYMRLPICGFCMNAWDILLQRPPHNTRPGSMSPGEWIRFCRVGGCDPDIWEYLDEETGLPNGKRVKLDNSTFHRRTNDDSRAPWRRQWASVTAKFHARKNQHYEKVRDQYGNIVSRALQDDAIQWDDDEFEQVSDVVEDAPDDDIW